MIRECNNGAHGSPDDYFFEDDKQMGIPHAMVIQLQTEGIMALETLQILRRILFSNLQTTYVAQEEGSLTQAPMLPLEQLFQCLPLHLVQNTGRGFLWLVTLSNTTIQWAET